MPAKKRFKSRLLGMLTRSDAYLRNIQIDSAKVSH